MIEAVILICSLGMAANACTERTTDDVVHVKVSPAICAMAAQTIIAGEAGARARAQHESDLRTKGVSS